MYSGMWTATVVTFDDDGNQVGDTKVIATGSTFAEVSKPGRAHHMATGEVVLINDAQYDIVTQYGYYD